MLSFVILAYNEGAGIRAALTRTVNTLRDNAIDFELVLVDDGSTDDTLERAEDVARLLPEIRIVRHSTNRGFPEALLTGHRAAQGDVILCDAADLCFDPSDTKAALARIEAGADVVVVERENRQAYGMVRKVMSETNGRLVRWLFGSPFTDHNFVQAYRRHVIEEIEVVTRGVSTVSTELILKARQRGFRIDSIRCPYHERSFGRSTISFGDVVHTVVELYKLRKVMTCRLEPFHTRIRCGHNDDPFRKTKAVNLTETTWPPSSRVP